MPICLNDKKKTYKGTEPSPKGLGYCAHAEKLGTKKVGLEGKWWWIVKSFNGIKKWVKLTPISQKLDDLPSLVYGQNMHKSNKKFIQNSTKKAQKYVEKCYNLKNILNKHNIETIIVFNEFDENVGVFWADYPGDVVKSYLEKKYKTPSYDLDIPYINIVIYVRNEKIINRPFHINFSLKRKNKDIVFEEATKIFGKSYIWDKNIRHSMHIEWN